MAWRKKYYSEMGGEATYFTIKSTSPPLEAGIEEWGITIQKYSLYQYLRQKLI